MAGVIATINEIRRRLAVVRSAEEVKELRDRAAALAEYLRRVKAGLEALNLMAEVKLQLDRQFGAFLLEEPDYGRGRKSVTVTDLKIDHSEARRVQKLASIPEELFDAKIEEIKASGRELTRAEMLRYCESVGRNGTATARPGPAPAAPDPDWRDAPVGRLSGMTAAAARVLERHRVGTAGQLADALDRGGLPTLTAADRAALREGLASLRGYDAPPRPDPGPMGEAERAEFEAEHVHGPLPPSPAEVAAAGRLSGSALTAFVGAVLDAAERLVADLIALRGHYGGGSPEWADVCVLVERLNRVKIDCIRREGSGG